MKNVLVLGAGLVSRPLIDYLLSRNISVSVASKAFTQETQIVIEKHKNGKLIQWDIEDISSLQGMIKNSDFVVSLLPYSYHPRVARICLEYHKHLVTTSYVKQEMQELHEKAQKAGLLFLNEIGLDPGIDHMSAVKTIDDIKAKGGKIISFRSICGALPAPEASNNPFRYKFGWSPMGVALAGKNDGKYRENGRIVEVPSCELFKHYYHTEIPTIGKMEIYVNRDSLPYLSLYSIPEAQTIFRGTIRYPGWCDLWFLIANLGLLNTDVQQYNAMSYRDFMKSVLGIQQHDIRRAIAKKFAISEDSELLNALEWLGLFSDDVVKTQRGGTIEILVEKLLDKLSYQRGERDMVILQDEIIAQYHQKRVKHVSTLIDYGVPGQATAVARTVALPAACAVKLILDGKIEDTGVQIPVLPTIYRLVLEELATLGIKFKEEEIISAI